MLKPFRWMLHVALFAGSAAAGPPSTMDRVEKLLAFADAPATCQPVPPTPNPDGPGEALTSCISTQEGAQLNTMRTAADRTVWINYAGPWLRLEPGRAQWDTLRAGLERELGAPARSRGGCVLWQSADAVVRINLLGSPISDDPAVGLLRVVLTAADTPGAVDC